MLIVTVIAINVIWGKDEANKDKEDTYKTLTEYSDKNIISNNEESLEYNLQEELENILSKIDGVR